MKENKLIAEFMGAEWHKEFFKDVCIISANNISYKFHSSWDWLMPVVRKCFQTGDDTYEWDNIMDTLFTCDINIVYAQVVEFINQYNKNK